MVDRRDLWRNRELLLLALLFPVSAIVAVLLEEIDISTFFGLFIPASLGVLGSYALYRKRQIDKQHSLRQALRTEIEGMEFLEGWPDRFGASVPRTDIFSTTVFEANSNELGLLTEEETKPIVGFYNRLSVVQDLVNIHRQFYIEVKTSLGKSDTDKKKREKLLRSQLDKLSISRHRALLALDKKIGYDNSVSPRPSEISAGTILSESHPLVKRNVQPLVRHGLVEEISNNSFRVTKKGESIFEGDRSITNLEHEEYDLGGILNIARSLLAQLKGYIKNHLESTLRSDGDE